MGRQSESSAHTRPASRERAWVLAFCLLAAVHVFIYGAAFSFFNGVDEPAHFDTVTKYAHGHLPRALEPYTSDTLRAMALFDAKPYLGTNDAIELSPPPWTWPADKQAELVAVQKPAVPGADYECSQPPLYYTVAGGWWWLAGKLGLSEGNQLYGLHFLNVPIVMLVVWLGWVAARRVFPDHLFRRLAVPAFIAVMPQSCYYAIENDNPSPLFFSIAFCGLLRFWAAEIPGIALGAITGLALAGAFLTKITNTFPIIAFLIMLALLARRLRQQSKLTQSLPSFFALAVCAGLPALAWMIWCKMNFGDFTGSQPRADFWGWTTKPLLERWHHPLFTPYGVIKFANHFLPQFWQGEGTWHLRPTSFRLADCTYTAVTTGLLGIALVKIALRPISEPLERRRVLWMSCWLFASTVAFLVYVSISFDFHDCCYPSREFPYLYCGRQALAAIIPFMLLLVTGLDTLLVSLRAPVKFSILGALMALMLATEAAANRDIFSDSYNWFHM